jgi:HSP20 family molecular chaperone IbpA
MNKKIILLPLFSFIVFNGISASDRGMQDPFAGSYDIFDHIEQLNREIQSIFDYNFNQKAQDTSDSSKHRPSMPIPSISSDDKAVLIKLAIPGVEAEKIQVDEMPDKNGSYLLVTIPDKNQTIEMTVTPHVMTFSMRYEAKEERTENDTQKPVYHSYSSHASYMEQTLPAEVTFEKVTAEYENDAFTLTLPKVNQKTTVLQTIPVIKKWKLLIINS